MLAYILATLEWQAGAQKWQSSWTEVGNDNVFCISQFIKNLPPGGKGGGVQIDLMGSCSCTSRNVLPTAPPESSLEDSLAPSTRSCWMSLRERERPVPSYPFTVEHKKTR